MKKILLVLGLLVALISACAPSASVSVSPAADTPDVNTIVAQTFAAMTAQAAFVPSPTSEAAAEAPTITLTPTPEPGSISGTLSYPSQFIPPLRVVAFQVNGFNYRYVDTMQNQSAYQITGLKPGVYHVVAYVMDGTYAGGYTYAVLCGLSVDCTDHALIDVEVKSGQDTPNVNPGDWYAPEGSFPPMP